LKTKIDYRLIGSSKSNDSWENERYVRYEDFKNNEELIFQKIP